MGILETISTKFDKVILLLERLLQNQSTNDVFVDKAKPPTSYRAKKSMSTDSAPISACEIFSCSTENEALSLSTLNPQNIYYMEHSG